MEERTIPFVPEAAEVNVGLESEKVKTETSLPPIQAQASQCSVDTDKTESPVVERIVRPDGPREAEVNSGKSSVYNQSQTAQLSANSKESKIPSNRASRVLSFGGE